MDGRLDASHGHGVLPAKQAPKHAAGGGGGWPAVVLAAAGWLDVLLEHVQQRNRVGEPARSVNHNRGWMSKDEH